MVEAVCQGVCRAFLTFQVTIYGHFIGETILSALNQDAELEVLVCDNNSTDDSVAVAERVGDTRLRLASQPPAILTVLFWSEALIIPWGRALVVAVLLDLAAGHRGAASRLPVASPRLLDFPASSLWHSYRGRRSPPGLATCFTFVQGRALIRGTDPGPLFSPETAAA
ncbi:MAG: glycosyltransferase [Mesorhizobium sp.]|uniref:glycosyltransferase n=1 Tax=Mesorhizobium sp. TaxID=1871066 RepID=UPI0012165F88|nr:MAG: glycosyltransferase [Mesorhizobium sp.]